AGIDPFEQRIQSYQNNQVNKIVSMISQAGPPYQGSVALNQQAANSFGLLEIYETVLRRGKSLSIEGVPPVNYQSANNALLLAAGRLADLYMLLGNEAYADAADPTIAFGTDDHVYGAEASSIHCFMNQTASLMEEELDLLRGRDNSKFPSVTVAPHYNRLVWNFTRDITGGEVAYALNYNIRSQDGGVPGTISEADAAALYPQGHGDAWGHYLSAIKNYYRLLRNPNFVWVARAETINLGGADMVEVDYQDERKFVASAFIDIQTKVAMADSGLNPLGLAKNVIPFDIDPAQISQRKTHFEQIYERAVTAMNNAITVFNYANNSTQLLRRQADSIADFQKTVADREAVFNSRLN